MTSNMKKKTKKLSWMKLSKECRRVVKQARQLRTRSLGHANRIKYDLGRRRLVKRSKGILPLGDEAAIVLIYQPKGILKSTLMTLQWLDAKGVTPIVVSNTNLTESDRNLLLERSHLVIERPNVGYDFGGYREGIFTILERGIKLNALYVMNDSMWFPVKKDTDLIEKCRAAPEDLYGIHVGHYQQRIGNEFVQSYFFRFKKEILNSKAFRDYWMSIPMMQDKKEVVRFLELKMAARFHNKGFSYGGFTTWRDVLDLVLKSDDEGFLRRVFEYQSQMSEKERLLIEPLLKKGVNALEMRDILIPYIEEHTLFPELSWISPEILDALGIPFMKKAVNRAELVHQRHEAIRLGIPASYEKVILDELIGWDAK